MNSSGSTGAIPVHGYCHPKFTAVADAFVNNFSVHAEIGAATTVFHCGEKVVDLWAGYKDSDLSIPWEKDTLVCVMSTSKAIASIALLSLVDSGHIRLDAPIADYWPEFAQSNKGEITISQLMAQLAGLPVADSSSKDSYFANNDMEQALATQSPLWQPGSTPCYHSFTYGPLCQIIIKKVTGRTLGQYLRESLFGPLNIEFYVGLTAQEITRCADVILEDDIPTLTQIRTPGTLLNRAWQPLPTDGNIFQEEAFRLCEFASANGHSHARGLAEIYNCLCQDYVNDTHYLLDQKTIREATRERWNDVEQISMRRFRFATGFMLNNPYFYLGSNPKSFGHPGMGGPTGFADPDARIGFGYTCNHMKAINTTGPCAEALIDAIYQSLN